MRWLFLLLLILNVGYVTWELKREHPQNQHNSRLPPGVEQIVLLRELEPDTAAKQVVAQSSTRKIEEEPAATAPQQAVSGKPRAEIAVEGDSAANEKDKSAENQVAASDVEPIIKHITKPMTKPQTKHAVEPAADLCYTLGPFSDMKTLRLVTREIKDYVVEASFRSKEEQEQTMFRVFVRPVGSKQAAKAMIKELVSKNIRDYFIITDGPNKNGISLGYFSNKGRAYRHADRVRELGFDATAEPVFRSYTIYWLDYRIKAGNQIPQQIFDEHLENSSQQLSRACG